MTETGGYFAAVRWEFDEDRGQTYPEVLVTKADNLDEAVERFREYMTTHGLDWEPYSVEFHVSGPVAHLLLDPPNDDEEWDEEDGE